MKAHSICHQAVMRRLPLFCYTLPPPVNREGFQKKKSYTTVWALRDHLTPFHTKTSSPQWEDNGANECTTHCKETSHKELPMVYLFLALDWLRAASILNSKIKSLDYKTLRNVCPKWIKILKLKSLPYKECKDSGLSTRPFRPCQSTIQLKRWPYSAQGVSLISKTQLGLEGVPSATGPERLGKPNIRPTSAPSLISPDHRHCCINLRSTKECHYKPY